MAADHSTPSPPPSSRRRSSNLDGDDSAPLQPLPKNLRDSVSRVSVSRMPLPRLAGLDRRDSFGVQSGSTLEGTGSAAEEQKPGSDSQPLGSNWMLYFHSLMPCQGEATYPTLILGIPLVALYFSASWSPPCREFTPILAEAYNQIRAKHGSKCFEVVLVPLDKDPVEWKKYCEKMPWVTMRHEHRDNIIKVFMHFQVTQAPRLIVINSSGDIVSQNARGEPGCGFGFGCDPLAAYSYLMDKCNSMK